MGMADVATVLFNRFIRVDPAYPRWPDRDRFVMSAGHGSMLVYAVNHLLGHDDMGTDQIRVFRQTGSRTAGHPEYGPAKGIEITAGPLGQGITSAVGMALAERMAHARWPDLTDRWTYVIAGARLPDGGDQPRGNRPGGPPAAGRLIVPWDDNRINHRRQDGPVHQRRPEGALCRRALAYAGGGQA